jgi:DNA-binding LacI/PurR family transcriptional regulator
LLIIGLFRKALSAAKRFDQKHVPIILCREGVSGTIAEMGRPNFQTIADAAGVSKTTVFRAFHGKGVNARTRRRVLSIARKLGYKANPLVQAWMTQVRTSRALQYQGTLAYISAYVPEPVISEPGAVGRFLQGARQRARELGFGLEVFYPMQHPVSRERLTQILKGRGIVGAVVVAANYASPAQVHPLEEAHFPLVGDDIACASLAGVYENPARHFSINDQYTAGRLMARQLLGLGYRRPGLVINPYVDSITDSRFQAGFFSLNSFALRQPRVPILMSRTSEKEEFEVWFRACSPDVVVASFPFVLEWMRALRLKVPGEVGFATFDADPARLPHISGIDQQHEEVAAAAVDLVVQLINLNQFAAPRFARGSEIEGLWVPGATLQKRRPR